MFIILKLSIIYRNGKLKTKIVEMPYQCSQCENQELQIVHWNRKINAQENSDSDSDFYWHELKIQIFEH